MSNSFRCILGSCLEIGALWDYLWTFKLNSKHVNYFYLSYNVNGNRSDLIVPSLQLPTVNTSTLPINLNWTYTYINNTLILSKTFSFQTTITFHAILDTNILSSLGIILSNFIFATTSYSIPQK